MEYHKIDDSFALEDLENPAYYKGIADTAAQIVQQNRELIERTKCRDFRPEVELEFTRNGANTYLHEFFEAIASYEEGRVPRKPLSEFESTTDELIERLKQLPKAPIAELEAVKVRFGEIRLYWSVNYAIPRMPREAWLKKIFNEDEKHLKTELKALHMAYVQANIVSIKQRAARKRKQEDLSAEEKLLKENRQRVIKEIIRLQKLYKLSVPRAIKKLKTIETWKSRLGDLSVDTWCTYFYSRNRKSHE